MNGRLLPLLVALAGGLGLVPCPVRAQDTPSVPEIITTGTGRITLRPDRAVVSLHITTASATAADATALNGPVAARVEDALREFGLSSDAVRPKGFMLQPRRDPRGIDPQSGYESTTIYEVRVDDLTALGQVLDVAIAAGATRVPSVTFQSDSVESARRRALTLAVAAARDDAETLAAASGGRVGHLLQVRTPPGVVGGFGAGVSGATGAVYAQQPGTPIGISAIIQDVVVTATIEARWAYYR